MGIIFGSFITIIINKSINNIIIINTALFFYIFFIFIIIMSFLIFIDKVISFIKYNITRDNKSLLIFLFLPFISSFFISDSLLLILLLFYPGSSTLLSTKISLFFSFEIYNHLLLLYKRRIINKIFLVDQIQNLLKIFIFFI